MTNRPNVNCYMYGGRHLAMECKFKEAEFFSYGKKGHITRAYKTNPITRKREQRRKEQPSQSRADHIATTNSVNEAPEDIVYMMFPVRSTNSEPLYATVTVNEALICMEIDT